VDCFREFLRSIPPREELGVGNVLAGGRVLQLDHHAVDSRLWMTSDLIHVLRRRLAGVCFGLTPSECSGTWRTHLRPHHAVFRHVFGYGRGTRVHGRLRHADASHFPRAVRTEVLGTNSGLTILLGVGICLLGIVFAGMQNIQEKEMSTSRSVRRLKSSA